MTRYWLNEMDALRREVERAFEDCNGREWRRPFPRRAFLPDKATRAYPQLNFSEDHDNAYVEALAPGLDPDTLEISGGEDALRIEGKKPPLSEDVKVEAFHRNERGAGKFVRTLTLNTTVDADKITAEYRHGLLQVTLPKAEAAKPKQIDVKVA